MIHALRLEDAAGEAANVVGREDQDDDAENDAAGDDVIADYEDEEKDS
ncbi:hypothetical protein A2U01_0092052, partial [Trifolium medium]|nr:hypothetical protein [Trifolium medium]